MKTKITVEIEGDERTAVNLINDLVLLIKNHDEPISHQDLDKKEVPPHFAIVGDKLFLDPDFLEAWERSSYIDKSDIFQILENTKIKGRSLIGKDQFTTMPDGGMCIPISMLNTLKGLKYF